MGFLSQEIVDELEGRSTEKCPVLRGEEIFTGEAADYPREWKGFVGQDPAKEQLYVKVTAALQLHRPMDHTLLESGWHGIGKTTLAYILAYQLGAGLVTTTGAGLTADSFYPLVAPLRDGDAIFVDEVHLAVEGGRNKTDWLLPWMLGNGVKTSTGVKQTPNVTLIAATTEVGKLPLTLLSRFVNRPPLGPYTPTQGALIAGDNARRMGVEVAQEHWASIATAADQNPRGMRNILAHIRDLRAVAPDSHPNLDKALEYAGVSADGLSLNARNFMAVLSVEKNRTASIETIRARLGEPGPLRHEEQVLLQRRYIEISGQGRRLTDAGERRIREEYAR